MEREEWRLLPGFNGWYEVSNWGRVRSNAPWGSAPPKEPRYLTLKIHRDGYLQVSLRSDGRAKLVQVHRLVALAWHGKPRSGEEVRHLDGSRTNNKASNLCWGTPKENAADRRLHGTDRLGERHGKSKLSPGQVKEILGSTDSDTALASRFGVSRGNIWSIRKKKSWSHIEGVAA